MGQARIKKEFVRAAKDRGDELPLEGVTFMLGAEGYPTTRYRVRVGQKAADFLERLDLNRIALKTMARQVLAVAAKTPVFPSQSSGDIFIWIPAEIPGFVATPAAVRNCFDGNISGFVAPRGYYPELPCSSTVVILVPEHLSREASRKDIPLQAITRLTLGHELAHVFGVQDGPLRPYWAHLELLTGCIDWATIREGFMETIADCVCLAANRDVIELHPEWASGFTYLDSLRTHLSAHEGRAIIRTAETYLADFRVLMGEILQLLLDAVASEPRVQEVVRRVIRLNAVAKATSDLSDRKAAQAGQEDESLRVS